MAEDAAAAKKGGNNKMMIIIAAAVVVVGGGGAAVAMKKGNKAADSQSAAEKKGSDKKLGQLVVVEDFIVNLNEPRSTRYLKVKFTLELGEAAVDLLAERKDVCRDAVLTYLSGLTVDDVRGSETKAALREELVSRINEALGVEGGVKNVMFTEFVVQ
jgi:flagellar FliL protein